jgi:hypothetical protein
MALKAGEMVKQPSSMRSFVFTILFLSSASLLALRADSFLAGQTVSSVQAVSKQAVRLDPATFESWKRRWHSSLLGEPQSQYCTRPMGEEIGWLTAHMLAAYYYGYLATGETQWVEKFIHCTDGWIANAVIEPDGFAGWPKFGAAGTDVDDLNSFYADSLLGEAMVLRSVVQMSNAILRAPDLKASYGAKAESYTKLSQSIFEKWDKRGAWRRTEGDGMISVVLPFGIDPATGKWTDGYATRNAPGHGFSHQDNKANLVASWLIAMADATGESAYRERAEKWFRIMRSRMKLDAVTGTFRIWNYWEPAGDWDYRLIGIRKHWVGVHPNPGYYEIDVEAIVTAYEHGLVFTDEDMRYLISTAIIERRYWPSLAPYDPIIREHFEETVKPDGWAGLTLTPWYLALRPQ